MRLLLLSGIVESIGALREQRRADELARNLDATVDEYVALVGHELGAGRIEATRRMVARMNRWGLGFGVITGLGLAGYSPAPGATETTLDHRDGS